MHPPLNTHLQLHPPPHVSISPLYQPSVHPPSFPGAHTRALSFSVSSSAALMCSTPPPPRHKSFLHLAELHALPLFPLPHGDSYSQRAHDTKEPFGEGSAVHASRFWNPKAVG